MKKIAIFQKNLSMGGIQRSLINLLNTIDVSKYSIDLYLMSTDKFYLESIPNSVNIIYLKPLKKIIRFMPFNILKKIYKSKIIKKYDIAIDFDGYSNDTALAMVSCNAKKHVMWIHQDLYNRKKQDKKYKLLFYLTRSKYKYVDEFVGVSQGVIDSFKKIIGFNFKYIVIPNIINSDQIIKKSKEKCFIKLNKSKINIVSVGRLCFQKGFDILIKYMYEIVKVNNNIVLYIIGNGPDYLKLKKLVNKYGLNNNIILLGEQTNPFSIMNQMDAFVLTSRYEGQGMVILEAKALGLPIVITKNLEKYNKGIPGSNNFIEDVLKLNKISKKKNNLLKDYNDDIIKSIDKLMSGNI